jgi:hypothetical protein
MTMIQEIMAAFVPLGGGSQSSRRGGAVTFKISSQDWGIMRLTEMV